MSIPVVSECFGDRCLYDGERVAVISGGAVEAVEHCKGSSYVEY